MPKTLRPLDTKLGVRAQHDLDAGQLALLLAIAAPDPAEKLIPLLESGHHIGLEYIVRDLVERVLVRHGQRALRAEQAITDAHRDLVARAFGFTHELTHHEPTRDELEPVLREGLAFLYDVEHPARPRACTHLGKNYRLGTWRNYSFVPAALGTHDGAVLVVETRGWDCDGLADGEIDRVVALLGELGTLSATTWNGEPGMPHGSIGLARSASESLMRNVFPDRFTAP